MDTTTPITKTQFNTAVVSMRELLQCVKSNESKEEQIALLHIIATAATTLASKIESK
ncbi:hypothetical protein UFOVP526_29 [uncultured Caudovirales phage]|uniref:Uncharacterized protein n=1 Tax=uncultured Caudovirales phage TaxID=2100421 RepID=A0A6J5MSL8_9CAUD|nr:hypothetical protein UFOVP526_29 [uncultured Caudovirales phage]